MATILRVGLTGNIAAGKTTVAARMAEHGCLVIDADVLGHDCLEPGEAAHDAVVARFGKGVVTEQGHVDRAALGRRVFADADARHALEQIVHPCIRRREAAAVERWATVVDHGIAVTEAALLYETGGAARYHRMIVVVAPDEIRLARLRASGLEDGEARRRMSAQMSQDTKAERADYVVVNDGALDVTVARVDGLVDELRRDLEALRRGETLPRPPRRHRDGAG